MSEILKQKKTEEPMQTYRGVMLLLEGKKTPVFDLRLTYVISSEKQTILANSENNPHTVFPEKHST